MAARVDPPPPWNWEKALPAFTAYHRGERPSPERALEFADNATGYLHWSAFKHRPVPNGWTREELWTLIKYRRYAGYRPLPLLRSKSGEPLLLNRTDPMVAALHRIDTREALWSRLQGKESSETEVSYRLMAAIEEAHHSSAIEGAVTTRRQSRELIRTGRKPVTDSEKMVVNNFETIQQLDEWATSSLSAEMICEIQARITYGTLTDPEDVGRMRRDDDVRIHDVETNEVIYQPPPAAELSERMERLCEFANQTSSDELFLHPITRAILMHHQLAYDHPFADGNGRTARALFMWAILRSGYSWFRNLSISRAVYRARGRYYKAFRYVQTDEGDTTYFVRQQLRCIEQEVAHLARFLERRAALEKWLLDKKAISETLNARQLALVEHTLQLPRTVYSAKEHSRFHGVSQPTAWKDLTGMVLEGLLEERKQGRKSFYAATGKLSKLAEGRPIEQLKADQQAID